MNRQDVIEPAALKKEPGLRSPRKKLWEIEKGFHCSIIGTCLKLNELRKIARRCGLNIPDHALDYEVHSVFVNLASEQGRVSKSLQKTLERKFQAVVGRFSFAKTGKDLARLWETSADQGEISGPYWAVMTHPSASKNLTRRIFGEVHMLSHLVGASNRADIRKLQELDRKFCNLEERKAKAEALMKNRLLERDSHIRVLKERLSTAHKLERKLETAEKRLNELETDKELVRIRNSLNEIMARADLEGNRAEASERKAERLSRKVLDLEKRNKDFESDLERYKRECAVLEEELSSFLSPNLLPGDCAHCDGSECVCPKLRGWRVLYVGGRSNLVPYYRALVEQHGGEFFHHDGGVENAMKCLSEKLAGADVVPCPVDCVSHAACHRIKQTCKRLSRPFVLMRSSGLSTFARELNAIAQ